MAFAIRQGLRHTRHRVGGQQFGIEGRGASVTMKQQYEVRSVLDQFDKDHSYIESHRAEWLEQFPDSWVVVYGE